jgi:ABC-type dipeptide/oligopeptide/nickel transport system ATPase component
MTTTQNVPKIEPKLTQDYTVKQSKYDMVGKLPIRSVILGPSGSGKTVLLQNMILDIYRDCFNRIYIFSPSIEVDHTWQPVKDYISKHMNVQHTDKEPIYFDHYDPEALANIIDTQHKITDYMKKQNKRKLYQILIIVDDFADDPSFSRHSKLLHALYTRGRHNMISTITATQKFSSIHPIIRVNATSLFVYRLRNYKDLETFVEEVSAVADKKTILELYNIATSEPYSFLYVNLVAKDKNDMFFVRFDKKLQIED